jgi:hypothetical protein
VLREIEDEEVLFQSKKRRKALRQAAAHESTQTTTASKAQDGTFAKAQVEDINGVRFY